MSETQARPAVGDLLGPLRQRTAERKRPRLWEIDIALARVTTLEMNLARVTAEHEDERTAIMEVLACPKHPRPLSWNQFVAAGGTACSLCLTAERDAMRAALQEIKDTCGAVCPEFEICTHPWCQSSVAAWMTADYALSTAHLDAQQEPADA